MEGGTVRAAHNGLRDSWTHRLANLVPLHIRKNPSASNYDFETKKNVYFTGKGKASPFILTNEARAQATWKPEFLGEPTAF
ncbi:HNH endonuclease family protein [Bradyrhizobium vignae]|uniref:HNH endonuclease family protein n=1 Tax=Bradyrhizobium vignae TaxID=1549949 RepID=UPI00100B8A17|nr:HNH endonuclease family protein [Bradyrhizobium vignae]RXH06781.1 HNH endonuclease [Bradyrhizobium vignae]